MTNLTNPSTILRFYNCRSKEPKSWEWGRKVTWALEDAGINYEIWTPFEDEPYEARVKVESTDYNKAIALLIKLKE